MSGVIFLNMGIEVRENSNFRFLEGHEETDFGQGVFTPIIRERQRKTLFGYFRMKAMSSFVDSLFEVVVGF